MIEDFLHLPPVSLIPVANLELRIHLREFSKKFETTIMVYSGAWGKLIHEKNKKSKISWHCPFKGCKIQTTIPEQRIFVDIAGTSSEFNRYLCIVQGFFLTFAFKYSENCICRNYYIQDVLYWGLRVVWIRTQIAAIIFICAPKMLVSSFLPDMFSAIAWRAPV